MTHQRRPPKARPGQRRKPAKSRAAPASPENAAGERLQKVLAAAGIGSRRQCEELIVAGRVEIDRKVVTELGTRVDPAEHQVRVDGVALPRTKRVYYAVNKPPGVVSTNRDPAGRPRVIDLMPQQDDQRLFAVGRLDLSSEGLILVTNDGDLANLLTHPRYGVAKTYRVMVAGEPSLEQLEQLRRGIHLAEGIARVEHVEIKRKYKQAAILEMVLREGRNREVRRIFARLGHKVLKLVRIAVGPIRIGNLPPGGVRRLSPSEVEALRREVSSKATPSKPAPSKPAPSKATPRSR
jgi:23S rRNA pseudouridine2605 synthase